MSQRRKLIKRRSFLYGLGGLATIGSISVGKAIYERQQILALDNPNRDFTFNQELSLNQLASKKGIIYGAAGRKDILATNALYTDTIVQDCGIFVPEWEFKWSSGNLTMRPTPDSFNFTASDWIANFAASHKLRLRGHTLVWHESLPSWFKKTVNKKNAAQILENHINTVVKRYAGKIHSWDVVNEAIKPKDGRSDGLRITPWLEVLGRNYIDLAFRLTAAADPEALLVYNEAGLEYDNPTHEARRVAVLKLLERLRANGTPIHALGIESHLSPGESQNKFNAKKMRQFLQDVASLGLKIMITELDVSDRRLPKDINIRDRIVAAVYEDYLSTVLDEPAVIAVITWGFSDSYSWLQKIKPRKDKFPVRPLPLDENIQRKLAWNAIARALDNAPIR